MNIRSIITMGLLLLLAVPASAEINIDGFMQGLFGGRIDQDNPTSTEQTASETRMQLRVDHFGDNAEFFGRLDFVWDGADSADYEWELREGYLKFKMGSDFDFKVGRQILTWGTGDLIFINDVFAKDYQSFLVGRDDQYLKAPQNAIRMTYYNPLGALDVVWTPRFEPNRLPTGRRLSYYNPFAGGIVGTGMDEAFYFDPPTPDSKFENGEIALRLSRQMGFFNIAGYFYKGFYKNPMGAVFVDETTVLPVYPHLNVYGASVRGQKWGGVVWLEGGYFDSRDDQDGNNPLMPNSAVTGLAGYERQVATNLTANLQWQLDYMLDHDMYKLQQEMMGGFVRDEARHLVTTRVTKLLRQETVTLSAFVFFSPTDEDVYAKLSVAYKHSDEVTLAAGANIFDGKYEATDYGQFQKNDNIWVKMTYGF